MTQQSVTFELSLTDLIEHKQRIVRDLVGTYTPHPLQYDYEEEDKEAHVSVTFFEDRVRLTRKGQATTQIEFNPHQNSLFSIDDQNLRLEGVCETIKLVHMKQYLFVHYRLTKEGQLVAEQEMELKVKVSEA